MKHGYYSIGIVPLPTFEHVAFRKLIIISKLEQYAQVLPTI